MAYEQQQHFPGQHHPYPTPVILKKQKAKSRFVELLNKHALPINRFINENIEIGVDDLTNLDHQRFVELCNFFKLNPIEKIRFEKLVNELSIGEEHFNNNEKPSIDTYNHNKTIPTSKHESFLIRQLDNEHDKMQYISKLAEFMLTRINDKCSVCHQQINKIFDTQKDNIINILNNKKQQLHDNIKEFNQKQSLYIQNQLKTIEEYQAEIRQTRSDCSNVLESQQYGEDREDTITQIIQSLLSIHAKYNTYRNGKELNTNLGEISKEIKIEFEPMIIESCIDKLVIIESIIDENMRSKIEEINKHYIEQSINNMNPNAISPTYSANSSLPSPHINTTNNKRASGASYDQYDIDHNHLNSPIHNGLNNHVNHHYNHNTSSQSMYSLNQYNNINNINNMNDMFNNNEANNEIQNRSHSYSQIYNAQRQSLGSYNHFEQKQQHSNYALNTPPVISTVPNGPTVPQMRNRPYSFAYNDQSYPPITFKNNEGIGNKSNPMHGINAINEMESENDYDNMNNIPSLPKYIASNSPPFNSQSHMKPPINFSQLPNGYNNNNNNNINIQAHNMQIQMQNSSNSDKSNHSKNSITQTMFPPTLTQSESNHENDGDIQAFIQETIKMKQEQKDINDDIINDNSEDEERAHSIEAMYEPGKVIQTTSGNKYEEKDEKINHKPAPINMNMPNHINIDITNSDLLDCNPIEIMQNYNHKKESNFINSIAVDIDNGNSKMSIIPIQNHNSVNSSQYTESRSRPTSVQSAVSEFNDPKWAVYGVGHNMSYEFGVNHNNNLNTFQQMDWQIDDNKDEEDDEKKEIIDPQTNGIIYHKLKNTFSDGLGFINNGPGWHMYLFGGGQLYCAGSNASGCFSMGKDKKGTYIQTLTQHSYFTDNNIKLRYLSYGNSGHHSFVITEMNDIYALGESLHYQLALDSEDMVKNKTNYIPQRISFFDNVIISKIGTGKKFTIFVSGHGIIYSCGTNLFGALGFGDEITTLKKPKVIDRIKRAKSIDVCCGENHSVILDVNGKVWTFGINNQGQLGRNTKNNLDYPAVVHISGRKLSKKFSVGQSHSKVNKIASGNNHVAVITEACKLFLWGANEKGQLGDGTQKVRYKGKQLTIKNELIKDISCGSNHSVIITKGRKVYVCGCNEYYQCQLQDNGGNGNGYSGMAKNIVLKPRLLTFENQPDIDQQIKRIFAGHNSTFVAVDTNMYVDRLCV